MVGKKFHVQKYTHRRCKRYDAIGSKQMSRCCPRGRCCSPPPPPPPIVHGCGIDIQSCSQSIKTDSGSNCDSLVLQHQRAQQTNQIVVAPTSLALSAACHSLGASSALLEMTCGRVAMGVDNPSLAEGDAALNVEMGIAELAVQTLGSGTPAAVRVIPAAVQIDPTPAGTLAFFGSAGATRPVGTGMTLPDLIAALQAYGLLA